MLNEHHDTPQHRLNELFASYAAGVVSGPSMALVDGHLELCPENRPWVDALAGVGGALLDDEDGAEITGRDAMLEAIFGDNNDDTPISASVRVTDPGPLPDAIATLVGRDFSDIPWKSRMPGLKEYVIPTDDGTEASLLWIKAGTAMPVHTHEGTEATLVLQGAFSDGEGRYGRGDIAVADDTVDHKPVAEAGEDCICFAVCDAPLRLTGPLGRFLSPFMRRST